MQKAMSEAYLLCNLSPQVNQVISKADNEQTIARVYTWLCNFCHFLLLSSNVGKEMPISRIVAAVPNTTIVYYIH
jgi:hypothetical protein